jgi:UDPglucose--hexose-1-phosphate uridylyltransferase
LSEFRKDIISGEWVIISKERARRPEIFKSESRVKTISTEVCPFCSGNEHMTPGEVFSIDSFEGRKPNTSGWKVRVVPNKFPALFPKIDLEIGREGIYDIMSGFGVHEVVINTPRHTYNVGDLSSDELKLMVEAYIRRIGELKKDERIKSIIIMLNQGKEAGASLEHTHSQIFGVPFIPPKIGKELSGTIEYFNNNNRCAMCEIINFEKKEDERIIFEDEHFVIIEPFASKVPFETWIVPKRHAYEFESISCEELNSFSYCLKNVLDVFSYELGEPPFNYYIHSSPTFIDTGKYYHWHLEFLPKLSIPAGFEIGTGVNINIAPLEQTADFIREKLKIKK